jgi:O-antigen/teichoic acid export membrane protein
LSVKQQDGQSLKSEAIGGMTWLLGQSVVTRIIVMAGQLILAWLLTPQDFGTIGLATTVTTLTTVIVSFGMDEVLLQRRSTIGLWSNAAFWITVWTGGVGLAVVLIAAPFVGAAYHSKELPSLLVILALAVPLAAMAVVPGVRLRANTRFGLLATYNMIEILGIQGGSILLAALGAGPYSFAIPVPLMAAIKLLVYWINTPFRIHPQPKWRHYGYLLSKGIAILGQRIIIAAVAQGDYVILGLLATQSVVGVYCFAFRLSAQPTGMLAGSFQSVLFPVLARVRTDPKRQGQAALKTAQVLGYTVMPFCFLQAAVAGPALRLLFGLKWESAVPLMQILSFGLAFDAISWIASGLLAARAEFALGFRIWLTLCPSFFVLAYLGAWFGSAEGLALGVTCYYGLITPCYSWLVFRRASVRLGDLMRLYVLPALIAAIAMGAAYFGATFLAKDLSRFFFICTVGPILYILALYLLHPTLLKDAMELLRKGHFIPSMAKMP